MNYETLNLNVHIENLFAATSLRVTKEPTQEGANRINEPRRLLGKKTSCPFCEKKLFHMIEFWNNFFLQLVIINLYSCPST
jgi:hypothetical protein